MFAKENIGGIIHWDGSRTQARWHSGRTDWDRGHFDHQNHSGLGPYHWHHGCGPHLHPLGSSLIDLLMGYGASFSTEANRINENIVYEFRSWIEIEKGKKYFILEIIGTGGGFYLAYNGEKKWIDAFFGTELCPEFISRQDSPWSGVTGGLDFLVNAEYFRNIMKKYFGLEGSGKLELSVPIVQKYLPSSYQHGKQQVKMLVLHDTGNVEGDTAEGNYKYFSTNQTAINNGTTAHAFIDNTQLIQMIPSDQSAWQVKGSYNGKAFNSDSYGLELCNLLNQNDVDKQFDNAAKYYAQMCIDFNLDPHKDIYSHNELTVLGNIAGGHVDPTAYLAKWGYDIDMFRDSVADYMK